MSDPKSSGHPADGPADGAQDAERSGPPKPTPSPLLGQAIVAIVSLVLGFIVLQVVLWVIDFLWLDLATRITGPALAAMVLVLPTAAGVIVAVLRKRADGHEPLNGLSLAPISGADYPWILGTIVIGLAGGLVLGPEVALVSTGSAVGSVLGGRFGLGARGIAVGAIAALLALFIGPLTSDSQRVTQDFDLSASSLAIAVAGSVVAVCLVAAARFLGIRIQHAAGPPPPRTWFPAAAGLAVGAIAWTYYLITDQQVALVLTSGERMIRPLLELGTTSLIAGTVLVKVVLYGISLGAGFRGGPYFPTFFIGAGGSAVLGLMVGANPGHAAAAGLVAATLYLAKPKWPLAVGLAMALGWVFGSWIGVLLALPAMLVGMLIPRLDPPTVAQPEPAVAGS